MFSRQKAKDKEAHLKEMKAGIESLKKRMKEYEVTLPLAPPQAKEEYKGYHESMKKDMVDVVTQLKPLDNPTAPPAPGTGLFGNVPAEEARLEDVHLQEKECMDIGKKCS